MSVSPPSTPDLTGRFPTPSPTVVLEGDDRDRSTAIAAFVVGADDAESVRLPDLPGTYQGVRHWLTTAGFTGKAGSIQLVPADPEPAWVVGVGAGTASDWRRAGAVLARAVRDRRAAEPEQPVADQVTALLPEETDGDAVVALATGLLLGGYRFRVSADEPRLTPPTFLVRPPAALDPVATGEALAEASVLAEATSVARDLANTPSNVKDPAWLADSAALLAEDVPGLDVTVRDETWLRDRGFGGVLAVGGGSRRPPRLVELSWRPSDSGTGPHLVLVGKGITFDTGGLSLKPAEGMHLMRTDMAGGGAVIAAVRAVARLGLPIRVTGLVPCAENHVSGSSYRPGDVVRHYGGTTTEITNTDAEGRLVLADALAYAVRDLGADVLVDVATLTGAMKVSLGLRTGGVLTDDDELARELVSAGEAVGEAWWRMPLLDEYASEVTGEIGDVRQCPPGPGGITAALFLREFTGATRWAHLDVAGPARSDRDYAEVTTGASGFAARTLVGLARDRARR
ncbi:leucyl aminopeptidase family protein [Actinoalloteichus sp. AHMU CJ021]|uniref:Probable cytosol aminopeptidase n=1 Tax=Actinoalloteichus caeruleus DSM 43889 TaxID=1120930 RepID=A0ABT1JJ13_ACTCY|nr:leucyl aminopeptidase family protein [Actinoalloteichus caeruleus]AUS78238.1 leucyl aminopeptidase family protein [Actinoalloteichus sp. AHMU CJ021]MCP2332284.1 leucyl aminopeptidase [Actinoalloteichus caeruleus DSM 43889]